MYFHVQYIDNFINDFSFFGERPFTWSPKIFPKWITRSRNTLTQMRPWSYSSLEHVISRAIHREPLLTFLAFRRTTLYRISQIIPETDNSVLGHATEMTSGSYWSLEHVLSRQWHNYPLLTILAFLVNDPLPDLQNFPELDNSLYLPGKDNSVQEHTTEMRSGSYWSFENVLSRAIQMEPLLATVAFSANDPLPDLPNFLRNG